MDIYINYFPFLFFENLVKESHYKFVGQVNLNVLDPIFSDEI